MINRAEMISYGELETRLPVFTDQQIQSGLRDKIERVRGKVELPLRFLSGWEWDHLFSFEGEKFAKVKFGKATGRVESDRLQQLGLEIMKQYGLNEDVSYPTYTNGDW